MCIGKIESVDRKTARLQILSAWYLNPAGDRMENITLINGSEDPSSNNKSNNDNNDYNYYLLFGKSILLFLTSESYVKVRWFTAVVL